MSISYNKHVLCSPPEKLTEIVTVFSETRPTKTLAVLFNHPFNGHRSNVNKWMLKPMNLFQICL